MVGFLPNGQWLESTISYTFTLGEESSQLSVIPGLGVSTYAQIEKNGFGHGKISKKLFKSIPLDVGWMLKRKKLCKWL